MTNGKINAALEFKKKKCLKYASKIKNNFYRNFMEDQIKSLFHEDHEESNLKLLISTVISNIDWIIYDAVYQDKDKSDFLNLTKNLTKKIMKIRFTLNNCIILHECIQESKQTIKININISPDKGGN